jgi:hypothetical protein
MAIQDCVEYIDTIVKSKVTLAGTNVFPSEKQMTKLFAQIHEESGRFSGKSAGWGQSFHSIAVYLLGSKSNMEQTFKQLEGKMEAICAELLKDATLGGNCDTFDAEPNYELVTVNLAGVDYTGYRLLINEIKIQRCF